MHVGIVGAGISGLYPALLLRREGHQVTIFKAQNRVGGRIYTHRFKPQAESKGVYFEAGAMRIPRSSLHSQVFDLIRYLDTHGSPESKIELIPYILDYEKNLSFFQNEKGSLHDRRWATKADLPELYRNTSPQQLLASVVLPWLDLLRHKFEVGFQNLMVYDEHSFRSYLRVMAGWPHEVIEFVVLFCSQTNQYNLSFTEIIMQNLDFDTKEWATIRNGMSRLTQSAATLVGFDNIRLNSQVNRAASITAPFDAVVIATPPSALQSILDRPTWSFMKEQSIRGVHYEPLYKVGLHFRTRFWECSAVNPCFGGQSTTDLRFRWIVFLSNDLGSNGPGVLLLYSWMSDATKWTGLSREERIKICLYDLSKYYADEKDINVYDQYIEAFDVMWTGESSGGDAMFLPGRFSRFFDVARRRPEGNTYFAGEHLSRHHTWIAGAIDSSLRTTAEVLGRKVDQDKANGRETVPSDPLPPLGREFLTPNDQRRARQTDISARRFKGCIIPRHMNVQYVELF